MRRPFQLIVWGASGFTGQLVCEYLLEKYPGEKLKWAMAGRSTRKLKEIQRKLQCDHIPILEADSNHLESLKKMVSQTAVILSVVGPYSLYGSHLIEACIREKRITAICPARFTG
jgi:short subunit dehydrogenase-like uncharacterized protein